MATNITVGETCVELEVFPLVDGKEDTKQIMTAQECYRLAGQLFDAGNELETKLMCKVGSRKDIWIPASGGTETPFISRSGRKLLYCWNPGQDKHAYLDMGTDTILSDAEAAQFMGNV